MSERPVTSTALCSLAAAAVSEAQGAYLSNLAIPFLQHQTGGLEEDALRAFGRPGSAGGPSGASRAGSTMALDEFGRLLTVVHERRHYADLMFSPLGLLQLRVLRSIEDTVHFLLEQTNHLPMPRTPSTMSPIIPWMESVGIPAMRRDPPLPPAGVVIPPDRMADWAEIAAHDAERHIAGLKCLIEFDRSLFDATPRTMRQFVLLANEAFDYLAERCDVDRRGRWSARDIQASSYLPVVAGVTTRMVLEASARLEELRYLHIADASEAVIDDWSASRLFGDYATAFKLSGDTLQSPRLMRYVMDAALRTPIDLVNGDGGTRFVEDLLPGHRLISAIGELRAEVAEGRSPGTGWVRSSLTRSGLRTTPLDALSEVTSRTLFGSQGWFADARARGISAESIRLHPRSRLLRRIERELRASRDDLLILGSGGAAAAVAQPSMEIFADLVSLPEGEDDDPAVVLGMLIDLIRSQATLALLGNGRAPEIAQVRAALEAEARVLGLDAEVGDFEATVRSAVSHIPNGEEMLNP